MAVVRVKTEVEVDVDVEVDIHSQMDVGDVINFIKYRSIDEYDAEYIVETLESQNLISKDEESIKGKCFCMSDEDAMQYLRWIAHYKSYLIQSA
ncbi:hypothetical protein [Campylobacter fetus]|uniref:hypothetical protein n=1 Tax=Campylobacter fetus TaxID=196 RepID=UPI00138DF4A1|nr:hypothetical protein [Campylobacter fetus]